MKRVARCLMLLASLICLPLAAQAAGRVLGDMDCTIKDRNLNFTFKSKFDYAANSALFAVDGEFESKNPKTYAPLKKFPVNADTLLMQWFYDAELKLRFYREIRSDDQPFAYVDLVILGKQVPNDDLHYAGTYTLSIQPAATGKDTDEDPFDLTGKVSCVMD